MLRLAPDALIAADCGHNTGLTAQYIRIKDTQRFAVSGTLASMGGGLPYAIAAALAFPGRQVVAIVGDGGLSMSIAELATCVRYKLPVKIVVLNNSSLAQIKWEQLMFLGNPEFGCDLQPVDFAIVAEGFGVRGFRIEDPATVRGRWTMRLRTMARRWSMPWSTPMSRCCRPSGARITSRT